MKTNYFIVGGAVAAPPRFEIFGHKKADEFPLVGFCGCSDGYLRAATTSHYAGQGQTAEDRGVGGRLRDGGR